MKICEIINIGNEKYIWTNEEWIHFGKIIKKYRIDKFTIIFSLDNILIYQIIIKENQEKTSVNLFLFLCEEYKSFTVDNFDLPKKLIISFGQNDYMYIGNECFYKFNNDITINEESIYLKKTYIERFTCK